MTNFKYKYEVIKAKYESLMDKFSTQKEEFIEDMKRLDNLISLLTDYFQAEIRNHDNPINDDYHKNQKIILNKLIELVDMNI